MDHSRSSSPEQNLWSSILDSVSSKRSLPSGNVLILGEPSSGKSTLASALLQKTATAVHHDDGEWSGKTDFALGYEWANVKEEGEEDIVARLSVYSVASSAPEHLALVPHFLPPRTSLPHTLVIIVLDWTKPWSFLEQLQTWLTWVEDWVNSDKSRDVQVLREEGRDRLQSHLQHYTEPSAAPGSVDSLPTVVLSLNSTLLPLGQGTFTHNSAGIPIIVTCSKADLIDDEIDAGIGIAKGKGGEWEERTDAVMQVLRTICLKYGAGLFYTTQQPTTLSYLRQYVLHFLFMPPPPPPDSAPLKYPFPFTHRPNILDRDRIMVPAGWDSWSKISILRDGFEASRWGEAWEKDLENKNIPASGARDLFRTLVGRQQGPKAAPLGPLIVTESEQVFLTNHYENLAKDRDPRQTFRQPQTTDPASGGYASGAGVVGPMGSSSLSLPSVERAMMELEGEDVGARLLRATGGAGVPRRDNRPTGGPPLPSIPAVTTNVLPSRGAPASTVPLATPGGATVGVGAGTGEGRTQNEVLHNFFQSLLINRAATGGGSGSAGTAQVTPPPSITPPLPNGVNGNESSNHDVGDS